MKNKTAFGVLNVKASFQFKAFFLSLKSSYLFQKN